MNVNKVMIAGNLTRDPELRQTGNGLSVCGIGMAMNRRWKTDNGEDKQETTFIDCTAFGKTGEVINEHFRKGKEIFIEGRLHYETWEDKSGGKRSKLSVTIESFSFVGKKEDGDGVGYGGEARHDKQTTQLRASAKEAVKQNLTRPPARRNAPADASMRQATPVDTAGSMDDEIPF